MNQTRRCGDGGVGVLLRRLSLPLVLAGTGLALFVSGYRFGDLSQWLRTTGDGAPLLFIAAGTLSMSMMMPKTMVSLAAGALFGTRAGCPIMLVTAVVAAIVNYQIGKHWIGSGRDFLSRDFPSRDTYSSESSPDPSSPLDLAASDAQPAKLSVALAQIARDAGFGLHLLVRLSPIPTTVISYSMGAVEARRAPYVGAAAVAVLPQLLYVHAASLAMDADQSERYRWISSVMSLAVAVIVSVALPQIAMRRLKQLRG